ncbi:ABC transporter substrate-binding protein [Streptomyces sp. NPDC050145]|uniref:ABC transporter substrate-binding protein n=1 Tax=Streptomyces sp. NPDC050145 TaxID=3365602 RepID=UPI00378AA07A
MKQPLTRTTALALLCTLALGAAACGKKNSGDSAEGKADASFSYTSTWGRDEPQAKIFRAAIADFTASTGIKVDVKWMGRNGTDTLATEMAAGRGPDLFDTGTDTMGKLRAQNLLAPLEDVLNQKIPGEGKTVGDVLPAAAEEASSDEKGLGLIPHTVISTGVWFDANKHPDLAETPPRTWPEFTAYLDKAKKAGRTPLGQDGTVPFYNAYWFYSALVRANGAGSLHALGTDAAAWDRPEVLAAAKQVQQLAEGGYFQKDFIATKYPAAQDKFATGTYDLNINGTWLTSEIKPKLPADAKIESFQYPAGGKNSVEAGTLGWGVNAKGKHPDAAKKFLAFFQQKKYASRIGTEALNIPARSGVPAPENLTGMQKTITDATAVHKPYDGAPALNAWWTDIFMPLDDKLLSGKITAREFVAQGKEKSAASIKANS